LKRAVVIAAALGAAWYATRHPGESPLATPQGPRPGAASPAPDRAAFNRGASGSMMRVGGQVERLLADDNDGSQHQRFIIRTDAGVTLLIAHNIDLAPRLVGLAVGDAVEAYGEYEWNDQGGLMHWTHKDPGGSHAAGHIEWRGRRYQ
jgi:hypothetical protein